MALNFPQNPNIGDRYTADASGFVYEWTGETWVIVGGPDQAGGGAGGTLKDILDDGNTRVGNAVELNFVGATVTNDGGARATVTIDTTGTGTLKDVHKDGSSVVVDGSIIDFLGPGVTVVDGGGGRAQVTIPGDTTQGTFHTAMDDGVAVVTNGSELNFTGAGVAVADAGAGRATINIPGVGTMPQNALKGRVSAGSGAPENLTIANIPADTMDPTDVVLGFNTIGALVQFPAADWIESVLTADGDLLSYDGSTYTKLGIGQDGEVLTARPGNGAGLKLAWEAAAGGGVTNPPQLKGDIWTHNGTTTVRLGVGGNGLVLEADDSAPSGLKWGSKTGTGGTGTYQFAQDNGVAAATDDTTMNFVDNGSIAWAISSAADITAVSASVLESGVDHNTLANYQANEHIDHATVTITGDGSLAGGGDLTTSRTLTLVNDNVAPGNNQRYGTNGVGTKGFHPITEEANVSTTPASLTGNDADINMAKSGVDLQKRKIAGAASSRIAVTQSADTITIDTGSAIARTDQAEQFDDTLNVVGILSEDGIPVVQPTATALGAGTHNIDFTKSNSPRYYTNAAITLDTPVGNGTGELVMNTGASVTLTGTPAGGSWAVKGSRNAGEVQTAYISQDTVNGFTIFAYG